MSVPHDRVTQVVVRVEGGGPGTDQFLTPKIAQIFSPCLIFIKGKQGLWLITGVYNSELVSVYKSELVSAKNDLQA